MKFKFYRNEQSIRERVHSILKMEQVDPGLYNKSIIKTLCEFYRFDLRAILNYLQMILQKSSLTRETFLSELKHDLGEQTSYFDVMNRLFFKGKSNFWSTKIQDFKDYSRIGFLSEGRFSDRMRHLEMSYFGKKSEANRCDPYGSSFTPMSDIERNLKYRKE